MTVETETRTSNDGTSSGGSLAPRTIRRPSRRPGLLLPTIILLALAIYLDRSGSLPFWPQGMLQTRLAPYLPETLRNLLPPIGKPAPAPALSGPTPDGPQAAAPATGTPTAAGRRNGAPIPVLVAAAGSEDVPVIATAVGTVQALATVTVRTQVDGPLLELAFKDGQDVRKGDILARIDARTYQAQYDQAIAKKAQDEAILANARIDLQRYDRLATADYGTKQQADTQRALVTQDEAQVRADQGAIDNTRAMLDNCTIRAPLDGRTGIRAVDQGNVVHAADVNGLVVITQIHPISVLFNVPQQQLKAVFAAIGKGPVATEALEADDTTIIEQGHIEVIDNQVDQTTGTIRLKATFPNVREQLWPGQFVNVHVLVDTLRHATVVPTGAVQRGPNGAYVFVLQPNGTVRQTPVTVGRQTEAKAVILSGIAPEAKVVTTGFTRLVDGSQVAVGAADGANPASPAASPVPAAKPATAPVPPT